MFAPANPLVPTEEPEEETDEPAEPSEKEKEALAMAVAGTGGVWNQ